MFKTWIAFKLVYNLQNDFIDTSSQFGLTDRYWPLKAVENLSFIGGLQSEVTRILVDSSLKLAKTSRNVKT